MVAYRRNYVEGGCYFFTVTLLDRRSSLLTENIDALRSAFRKVKQRHPFAIKAIVILPEHLHCIWQLPSNDANYSLRWREIKSAFSRTFIPSEQKSASRKKRKERGIWQRRFWEHTIRDEDDYQRHVDYIHYNPVKHGYVDQVYLWEYSSFHQYVAKGDLAGNWAESSDVNLNTPE
jgi:putative transposase